MDLGNVRIVADPVNNALIITARAQDYKEIEAVIKELDALPLQVLIDATIVEVTLTGRLRYGLQWYFAHSADPSGAGVLGDMSNLTAPLASAFGGGFTYSLVTNAQKIRLELDLLAKDNKVNVISSPSVMSLNNQEAQIMVGTTVPVATSQTYGTLTAGAAVTSGFQYVDTGTILHVRPRVNAGGLVTMEVRQEVSAAQPVAIGNTNTNQISKRTISSAVAVNSGGTLVLGGLITDNRTTDVTGIPILSQIPYLGALFGTTDKNLTRTELVVLLTPRVVQQKRELDGITQEFKRKLTGLYEELSIRPGTPRTPPR
jgi:general secretion pathway protein D